MEIRILKQNGIGTLQYRVVGLATWNNVPIVEEEKFIVGGMYESSHITVVCLEDTDCDSFKGITTKCLPNSHWEIGRTSYGLNKKLFKRKT